MTNILEQILPQDVQKEVKALHLAVEKKPFLKRYLGQTESPLTLLDHYRHLRQLQCIYSTFKERLASKEFTPKLPESLSCLLQRADKIESDLAFLAQYVKDPDKDVILESTNNYVAYLKTIKVEEGKTSHELLIHFLVSILGDLNGGQFLKNIVKKMYRTNEIYSDEVPDNGVTFYHFDKSTTGNLTDWLKSFITFRNLKEDDQAISASVRPCAREDDPNAIVLGKGAITAFKMQTSIIDQLESTRVTPPSLKRNMENVQLAQNSSGFFSCNNLTKAVAVVGLAVTAGLAITTTLNRFGS